MRNDLQRLTKISNKSEDLNGSKNLLDLFVYKLKNMEAK